MAKELKQLTVNGVTNTMLVELLSTSPDRLIYFVIENGNRHIVEFDGDMNLVFCAQMSQDFIGYEARRTETPDYICTGGLVWNKNTRTLHPQGIGVVLGNVIHSGSKFPLGVNQVIYQSARFSYQYYDLARIAIGPSTYTQLHTYTWRFATSNYEGMSALILEDSNDIIAWSKGVITRMAPGNSNHVWAKVYATVGWPTVVHRLDASTLLVIIRRSGPSKYVQEFFTIAIADGSVTPLFALTELWGTDYVQGFIPQKDNNGNMRLMYQRRNPCEVDLSGNVTYGTVIGSGAYSSLHHLSYFLGFDPVNDGNILWGQYEGPIFSDDRVPFNHVTEAGYVNFAPWRLSPATIITTWSNSTPAVSALAPPAAVGYTTHTITMTARSASITAIDDFAIPSTPLPPPAPVLPAPIGSVTRVPAEITFPWEQALSNARSTSYWWDYDDQFYNDPSIDGVQFNVFVGGDATPLSANASLSLGMYDSSEVGLGNALGYGAIYLGIGPQSPSVYFSYTDEFSLSNVESRYVFNEISSDAVTPGLYTLPGVATMTDWDIGYLYTEDYGLPFLMEMYYSDNQSKANQGVSYNGYTQYAHVNNLCPSFTRTYIPGAHVRKYVSGVLKVSADTTNPDVSDIMFGVMYTGDETGGTGIIVCDGVIVGSTTAVGPVFDMYGDIGFASDLVPLADLVVSSAGTSYLSLNLYAGYDPHIPVEYSTYAYEDDPLYPLQRGFNSYQTKFVHYLDHSTGLRTGEKLPGTWTYITATVPTMYTHPGWPYSTIFWTSFVGQREYA
jgi:hypothetical protein